MRGLVLKFVSRALVLSWMSSCDDFEVLSLRFRFRWTLGMGLGLWPCF